jgi:hypothetical protein
MAAMKIRYKRMPRPFPLYRVTIDGTPIGTVGRDSRGWLPYAFFVAPPLEQAFPTRRAAAEWLAAASGLWLVTR